MPENPRICEIKWGISDSPVGKFLLASSPIGIVHLSFLGTDEAESYEQLCREWPEASLIRSDRLIGELARQIFQTNPKEKPELDLRGTPFQIRVWSALKEIPRGQTTTYQRLARSIGKPSAARAVGNAIGKNRIAYLIPCHRVIRQDGSLGGFRWGTTCKSKLLAWEK